MWARFVGPIGTSRTECSLIIVGVGLDRGSLAKGETPIVDLGNSLLIDDDEGEAYEEYDD